MLFAVLILGALPVGTLSLAGHASADDRCTNNVNYAGDPRSNAVINSIGASTGQCPTPIPQAIGLPGLVDGAVLGQPCYNYPTYMFGQANNGNQLACVDQGTNTTGLWVRSVPVIGVRQIASRCSEADGVAAQSPDGRPLVCSSTAGWVPGP
jgi:hypothetical protein